MLSKRTLTILLAGALVVSPLTALTPNPEKALSKILKAAIASGNARAVQQAINTLSDGDPVRLLDFVKLAITDAKRLLALNPRAAVEIAAAVAASVNTPDLVNGSPQELMEIATIAAGILISPEAQSAAPDQVGQLAITAAQIVSNPVVYNSSPAAALKVMANAYAAVTSPAVSAASPSAAATVRQTLTDASANSALSQGNPSTPADISNILAGGGSDSPSKTTGGGSGSSTFPAFPITTVDASIVSPSN